MMVSTNGPCFVREEFASFLVGNGTEHITSALYHPASSGLAKWAVQIVKKDQLHLFSLTLNGLSH